MKQARSLPFFFAIAPLCIVIILIFVNVFTFGDENLSGPNQIALLIGAAIAAIIAFKRNISWKSILKEINENISKSSVAILILLCIGALSGLWMISGIIPTMIYYGLNILHPSFFFAATLVVCSIVSLVTGSSWSTVATVGIALMAIGKTIGLNPAITAGAIISGAYFGDKMSPMSDTTNIAAAVTNTELFEHIRYMFITTLPNYVLTLFIFIVMGIFMKSNISIDKIEFMQQTLDDIFFIHPLLLVVPVFVIFLMIKKVHALPALASGIAISVIVAIVFQPHVIQIIAGNHVVYVWDFYFSIIKAMSTEVSILPPEHQYAELLHTRGMAGMMNTIWLILCAMVFGGVMEAGGFLQRIAESIMKLARNETSLVTSTAATCVVVNLTASDQYLSIILTAKIYKNVYKKYKLHSKHLSRTLEDSGTLTSVLIPWNTCGATQSAVLGISTLAYLPYAFFNYFGVLFTIIITAIKFKMAKTNKE